MEESIVKDKRVCDNCDSTKTYIDKKRWLHWYNRRGKWYCEKCNNKLFKNPKWHSITNKRRVKFKDRKVFVDRNPRCGECSWCNKKIGDKYIDYHGIEKIIDKTHIHHIEYHDDDPLKDTVELCPSCHVAESWRLGCKLGRQRKN